MAPCRAETSASASDGRSASSSTWGRSRHAPSGWTSTPAARAPNAPRTASTDAAGVRRTSPAPARDASPRSAAAAAANPGSSSASGGTATSKRPRVPAGRVSRAMRTAVGVSRRTRSGTLPNRTRAAVALPSHPITRSEARVSAAARASARATFDSTRTSGSTGTSAPAAWTTADDSVRSPAATAAAWSGPPGTTVTAASGAAASGPRTSTARSTRASAVAGLASDTSTRSRPSRASGWRPSASRASRRPARSTTTGPTTHVTATIAIVPFSTAPSNRPTSTPTSTAASVAAACGTVSPNARRTSLEVNPNAGRRSAAAAPFVTRSVPVIASATAHAREAPGAANAPRSTSIPVESRKNGTKRALPKKPIRFISGPPSGTSRFSPSPARNAPMMGSMPSASTPSAHTNTAARTNTNSTVASCATDRKNHVPSRGRPHSTTPPTASSDPATRANTSASNPLPSRAPVATTASTRSASVSVRMVAPTAVVVARSFWSPSRAAAGYARSVWLANTLPRRTADGHAIPSASRPTSAPSAWGSRNVAAPNPRLRAFPSSSSWRSISSPARNMM